MTYRPGGVITIAIFSILIAALALVGAIVIWAILIPLEYQTWIGLITTDSYLVSLGQPPIIFYSDPSYLISTYTIYGVVALIFAGIYLVTGAGLLTMKKWGYYLGLIMGILSIIGGVIGLLFIIGIIPLIFGIVVVVYLAGDVKHEFE
jgi:hypothetical protein